MLPVPPPRGLARATAAALAAAPLLSVIDIVWSLGALDVVTSVRSGSDRYSTSDAWASNDRAVLSGGLSALALIVCAALFITWLYKSVVFQERTLKMGARHSRGWAIGGWFVPFLNLVRPKQIIDAVWSGTSRVADNGHVRSPTILNVWWATFIASNLLGNMSAQQARHTSLFDPNYRSVVNFGVASDVLGLVAGVLAIVIVLSIAELQTRAAAVAEAQHFTELVYLGRAPHAWQAAYPFKGKQSPTPTWTQPPPPSPARY